MTASRLPSTLAALAGALSLSLAAGAAHATVLTCPKANVVQAVPDEPVDHVAAPTNPAYLVAGTTYKWGAVRWQEPALGCATVGQTFDFWPATGGDPNANHPTIVYFHPNGATSHPKTDNPVYLNVIAPATAAGYNVVSAEFRHPVIDQYLAAQNGGKVFQNDTGLVIQYLRNNAAKFKISKNNIFAFGYSRGTLSLWQSLQPDMGGSNGKASSLVSAVMGYQAQTTYRCDQYASLFLDPLDPGTASEVASCEADNPRWKQYTSAIDSVSVNSPPIMLQYQDGFELQVNSKTAIHPVTYAYLDANYQVEHYPDFGIALYDAYQRVGNPRMAYPQAHVSYDQQFVGWQAFIAPLVKPDAP